jgi:hypothetical protein
VPNQPGDVPTGRGDVTDPWEVDTLCTEHLAKQANFIIKQQKQISMKSKYVHFIPKADPQLALWAANFKIKIRTLGASLGVTEEQIVALEAVVDRIIQAVTKVEVKRQELETAVSAKEEAKTDDVQLLVDTAVALKRHPNYTASMGSELGIIGSLLTVDPQNLKPVLKPKVYPGKVDLRFNLQKMNCISIYTRLKGSMGWEKLGNDFESPFEDKRPLALVNQPEMREYMAMYFNGREEVGQQSDIVSVLFGG